MVEVGYILASADAVSANLTAIAAGDSEIVHMDVSKLNIPDIPLDRRSYNYGLIFNDSTTIPVDIKIGKLFIHLRQGGSYEVGTDVFTNFTNAEVTNRHAANALNISDIKFYAARKATIEDGAV